MLFLFGVITWYLDKIMEWMALKNLHLINYCWAHHWSSNWNSPKKYFHICIRCDSTIVVRWPCIRKFDTLASLSKLNDKLKLLLYLNSKICGKYRCNNPMSFKLNTIHFITHARIHPHTHIYSDLQTMLCFSINYLLLIFQFTSLSTGGTHASAYMRAYVRAFLQIYFISIESII